LRFRAASNEQKIVLVKVRERHALQRDRVGGINRDHRVAAGRRGGGRQRRVVGNDRRVDLNDIVGAGSGGVSWRGRPASLFKLLSRVPRQLHLGVDGVAAPIIPSWFASYSAEWLS